MSSPVHNRKTRKGISSLYLLKALCAFLVVVIHAQMWGKDAIQPILGMATPCFLCITGFLLYSDNKEKELGKAIKWAKKALWLSIILNLLHMGQHLWDGVPISQYSVSGLLTNLFTGIAFSTHLWYLSALWTGLLFFYVLRRYAGLLIWVAPLLYCWAHVCFKWGADIFPQAEDYVLFLLRCNGLITGLPFLCTGYLIARHQERLTHLRLLTLWWGLCLLFLFFGSYVMRLLPIVTYGWPHFAVMYAFIVLTLALCIRYRDARIPGLNEIGQYHSANIYFFHILVLIHLGRIFPEIEPWQAISVFICSIPVSWCINKCTAGINKLKVAAQNHPTAACK